MQCKATQYELVIVESSVKVWSTVIRTGKPLAFRTPGTVRKSKQIMTLEDESHRSVVVQYVTGKRQRNSSRKTGEADLKWKPHTVVDMQGFFQVALVAKNPTVNAGDLRDSGSIPGLGRSPGKGSGNPFQYSCLENTMDREAWRVYSP